MDIIGDKQTLLSQWLLIVEHEAGHVCRYTYVGEEETRIFFGVGVVYQGKKDIDKCYNILAP